jgi:hypothetical protein
MGIFVLGTKKKVLLEKFGTTKQDIEKMVREIMKKKKVSKISIDFVNNVIYATVSGEIVEIEFLDLNKC